MGPTLRATTRFLRSYHRASPTLQQMAEGTLHDFVRSFRSNPAICIQEYEPVAKLRKCRRSDLTTTDIREFRIGQSGNEWLFLASSYRCDCGYECHFFENTIREMRKISLRRTQFLVEGGHRIEFTASEAVAVHCPTLGRRPTMGRELEAPA